MRKYILIVILFVALTYSNSLLNNFVGDDNFTVEKNNFITSWDNLPLLLSRKYISTSENVVFNSYRRKEYGSGEITYRPIVTLSYMADYSFWKLEPLGYHLTNLLLHTLNAILVYIFVLLLAESNPLAFFSSLLFATHPLTTEAVNSISAREELLVVFFLLSAFILFIRYKKYKGFKRYLLYGASCLAFFLGALSKEAAVVFPALVVLYDFLFELDCSARETLRNLKRYAGYILAALFYLIIYFFVFTPAVQSRLPFAGGSLYVHFLNIAVILARYISAFLIPFNIAIIPSFYYPLAGAVFTYEAAFSILLLLLVAFAGARIYRYSKLAFFGTAWFFIAILPASNVFFRLVNMFAFRYVYFPVIGLCIALAVAAFKFAGLPLIRRVSPSADKVVMFFIIGSYMAVSIPQNICWRNELTFGRNQLMYYPYVAEPYRAVAKHYFKKGYFDKAVENFKMSLKYKPIDSLSYNDLGICYFELGLLDESVKALSNAVKIRPAFAEAHYNLGTAYLAKRDFQKAKDSFKKTIEIDPLYAEAYNNLAITYTQLGKLEDARQMLKKALEISPANELAKENLSSLEKSLPKEN